MVSDRAYCNDDSQRCLRGQTAGQESASSTYREKSGRRVVSSDRLTMKYICFGYGEEKIPENERAFFIERCSSYVEDLRRIGCFVRGEVLENSEQTARVRSHGGKIMVTAGPYRKTKEQVNKFILIEAKDLNHAIRLISKHPSVELGETWEIRLSINPVSSISFPSVPG